MVVSYNIEYKFTVVYLAKLAVELTFYEVVCVLFLQSAMMLFCAVIQPVAS